MLRSQRFTKIASLGLASFALLNIGSSCTPPEQGNSGRYEDVHTNDGYAGQRADYSTLVRYCDEAAEKVASEIATAPEVRALGNKQGVLLLGDLVNHTNTPTRDFEQIQNRLRGKLVGSSFLRQHFIVVEDPARVRRMRERMRAPKEPNLLQDGNGAAPEKEFPDEYVFVITGDFFEADRQRQNFYFQFNVTNLATGAIVVNPTIDFGQRR